MAFTDRMQQEHRRVPSNIDAETSPGTKVLPAPCRLRTAQDVIDLLQEQVEAARADTEAAPLEKARIIGQLASLTLKAIEAGNLAARLEALEAVLKRHSKPWKPS
jgi:hypothetical protein